MYGTVDVVGLGFPKIETARHDRRRRQATHSSIRPGAAGVAELYRPLAPDDYSRALLLARARTDPARLLPVLREAAQANSQVPSGVRLLKDDFERRVSGTPNRERGGWLNRPADAAARLHRHFRRRVVRRKLTDQGDSAFISRSARQGIDPAAGHARGVVPGVVWHGRGHRRGRSNRLRAREQPAFNWPPPTRSHTPVR